MAKKGLKKIIFLLNLWFFIIGSLTSVILFHEFYHILTVEGEPTGICFGKCYIGDPLGKFAPAGIFWDFTTDGNIQLIENHKQDELNAWIFGFIITLILIIYSKIK